MARFALALLSMPVSGFADFAGLSSCAKVMADTASIPTPTKHDVTTLFRINYLLLVYWLFIFDFRLLLSCGILSRSSRTNPLPSAALPLSDRRSAFVQPRGTCRNHPQLPEDRCR